MPAPRLFRVIAADMGWAEQKIRPSVTIELKQEEVCGIVIGSEIQLPCAGDADSWNIAATKALREDSDKWKAWAGALLAAMRALPVGHSIESRAIAAGVVPCEEPR